MIEIESGAASASKPTVLIENFFTSGTVTESSETVGFEHENAYDGVTYDYWKPSSMPATLQVVLSASDSADCLCIAAHDLGTQGATIALETFNGSTWDEVASHTPTDDSTIMMLFPVTSDDTWRINVTGSTEPCIGWVALGQRIEFPVGIVGDYTPTDWSERTELFGGLTLSGNFLGQRVERTSAETVVSVGNLSKSWYQSTGKTFAKHYNDGKAFFFAGWPDTLSEDIALCWRGPKQSELNPAINQGEYVPLSFRVNCYV